jgi:hypothetical protein
MFFCWHLLLTQDAVGRDGASAPRAVCPVRLDGELPLLAWAHVQKALVPALDDLARTNGEGQGLATVVRSIELAAVALEGTAVVHVNLVAGNGLATAFDRLGDLGLQVLHRC